jgi:hypothetical protein
MSEISDKKPKCPECKSVRCKRDWQSESANMFGPNKTVGSLADENSKRFSSDYKHHLLYGDREEKWNKDAKKRWSEKGIEVLRGE